MKNYFRVPQHPSSAFNIHSCSFAISRVRNKKKERRKKLFLFLLRFLKFCRCASDFVTTAPFCIPSFRESVCAFFCLHIDILQNSYFFYSFLTSFAFTFRRYLFSGYANCYICAMSKCVSLNSSRLQNLFFFFDEGRKFENFAVGDG